MKKGEIQMQETILVIFIITVIIALGLFVFYRYNLSSLENERLNYEQEKVYALLSNLQNNPQLQYSYLGNNENAVDTLKLLNINLEDLGEKEIAIKQIYPKTEDKLCTSKNYPDCSSYVIYKKISSKKSVNIITTPVSLYFPLTNEYKAGLIEIKWYY